MDEFVSGAPRKYQGLAWFAGVLVSVAITVATLAFVFGSKATAITDSLSNHETRIKAIEDERKDLNDTVRHTDEVISAHFGVAAQPHHH